MGIIGTDVRNLKDLVHIHATLVAYSPPPCLLFFDVHSLTTTVTVTMTIYLRTIVLKYMNKIILLGDWESE